jgi:hypothetical protein
MLCSIDNPFRMRENLEILAARDGHKRDPAIFRESHPGGGGRRDGGDDRHAKPRRL